MLYGKFLPDGLNGNYCVYFLAKGALCDITTSRAFGIDINSFRVQYSGCFYPVLGVLQNVWMNLSWKKMYDRLASIK